MIKRVFAIICPSLNVECLSCAVLQINTAKQFPKVFFLKAYKCRRKMDSKRLNVCPAGLKVAVLRKDKSEGHFPKDSK